jgi:hypothetical protein
MNELLFSLIITLMSGIVYGIIKHKPVGNDNTVRLCAIVLSVFAGILLCLIDRSGNIINAFIGIIGSLIGYSFGTFKKGDG